ncbi:hypothetical protein [Maliponia aquimaris]|uniref:Uncharacterized protein n=1 Tax=Maliponia aquimaris TaxID=1673631 RepID=A0A238L514_9RHOB|nr:hypothetical protein [Maliponia aquimaris]SMX50099.1 hypothetical protein MAA8898_04601 [Maliponia aquimaris]
MKPVVNIHERAAISAPGKDFRNAHPGVIDRADDTPDDWEGAL